MEHEIRRRIVWNVADFIGRLMSLQMRSYLPADHYWHAYQYVFTLLCLLLPTKEPSDLGS